MNSNAAGEAPVDQRVKPLRAHGACAIAWALVAVAALASSSMQHIFGHAGPAMADALLTAFCVWRLFLLDQRLNVANNRPP